MSWLNSLVLEKVGIKFDPHKLKKYVDKVFVLIERIIIKLPRFLNYYIDFYSEMARKEIDLAGITKDDKILHLGCGSIPASSILFNKYTDAKVICIDINERSVSEAKICISLLNITKKLEVIHANALNYSMDSFDVIVISQGINPNKEVLKHISENINANARVIYRTSSTFNGELAGNDIFIKDLFNINKIAHHNKNGLLISVLLNKK